MALNILSDWSDAIDNSRNELVFENKNKSYGAYQIRKGYNRTILISGIVGIVSIFVMLAVPAILASANAAGKEKIISNEQITIDPIADMKEDLPPPPPPPLEEPPKIETTKFVETVIVDEEVKEEVKTQEELVDTKVSNIDQKGEDDGAIVIPEEKGKGDEIVDKPDEIFLVVEETAVFPGGESAMYKYLRGKLENSYPSYEKEAEIQGKVYVRFVVEKDGSITNADVVRKVSPGLDKLARTTVEGMPKWTPGKQGGKPVRMWFTLPVSFQLQ